MTKISLLFCMIAAINIFIMENIHASSNCELIQPSICNNLSYNRTTLPNFMGHYSQKQIREYLRLYSPVIKKHCSKYFKLFLCHLFFPSCTKDHQVLKPCKSLCLNVKRKCLGTIKEFGLDLFKYVDCSRLPSSKKNVCLKGLITNRFYKPEMNRNVIEGGRKFTCPPLLTVPLEFGYKLQIGNTEVKNCGIPCKDNQDYFFGTKEESLRKRKFARIWILVWSILCFLSTSFTVLTFILDRERFKYPERPIIFLSSCYLAVSFCYVIGYFLKEKAVCTGPFNNKLKDINQNQLSLELITQGTRKSECTILFMIIYFFSMASNIWWVILTFTWFLAAKLKWAHEAVESNAHFYHLLAWIIPAIKTIAILALGQIDGDVLSGVCFTGLSDLRILKGFIIAPLLIYLILGSSFLLAGFVSLCRIRFTIKADGNITDKLDKFILRIGIFSILYKFPAIIVIACHFYELGNRLDWMISFHGRACEMGFSCPPKRDYQPTPEYIYFMLKYLMMLIVGVTSGFWIWSTKTTLTWKKAYYRCFTKRQFINETDL
ncbi:unnamed protein product [Dimorphilus gyrociliatus]|uniref:Uncharacterized protein n=1 Tax=Dimorphilus gyrociliatus TaxID=2664684 RepID=A0A7I8W1V5_9ANNE|nr:unnamed protein product [Dimorphilus gyrociliatus]